MEKLEIENEKIAVKEIKEQIRRTDDSIPKYVWYLVDKNKDKKLKKVLKMDYLTIYPNENNKMCFIITLVDKILRYLLLFMLCVLLFMGAALILQGIFGISFSVYQGQSIEFKDNMQFFCFEIFFGIGCWVSCFLIGYGVINMRGDRYSLKKKDVKNMINKKVKAYNKRYDKYIY